jgi:hypothetical protein
MPVEPTLPQTVSLSSVSELRDQAQRLGLVWVLRPATVAETTGAFTAWVPRIDLDGDLDTSAGITAVSFIGGLAVGMRVMVVFIPPTGYYIVGTINPVQTQRYEIGAFTSHATTITTTETVMETFTAFSVLPGAAYRVEVGNGLLAATTAFTRFRLRKTNTAGQTLTASASFPGIGLAIAPMYYVGYFRNNTGAPITTNLVLTAVTLSGTSTWYADAETQRFVSLTYAGPAVNYPSAIGIT